MTNIAEDYVSFETAKLLKEKGFDVPTKYFFNTNGLCCQGENSYNWNDDKDVDDVCEDYSRPSIYVAMKWLREIHKIDITVDPHEVGNNWIYQFHICQNKDYLFSRDIDTSYENCAEAAIKYCLKRLNYEQLG